MKKSIDIMKRMDDLMELTGNNTIDKGDIWSNKSNSELPIDGSLYPVSEYLKMLSGFDREFYTRYIRQLQYFIGKYKLVGNKDIERLSPDIMRQAIEFGQVGLIKVKNEFVPVAVVKIENNYNKTIKEAEFITLRDGYGYTKDQKHLKRKGNELAYLKQNYQALPFIFFWKTIVDNIIKLEKAAVTGSIASIKKFKRNLQNNDSTISRIETNSMMDPNHPYVNNIVSPASYQSEQIRQQRGDLPGGEQALATAPNAIEFQSLDSKAESLWENLNSYLNYVYFHNNRRINTNKKNERNLEGEINTEVINFDILDQEFKNYLEAFVKQLNTNFNLSVRLSSFIEEKSVEKGKVIEEEPKKKGMFGGKNV